MTNLRNGEWYRANDGWFYCWPNPTPYREVPAGGDLPGAAPWTTGAPLPPRGPSGRKVLMWVGVPLVVVIGGLALLGRNFDAPPRGCATADQAAVRAEDLLRGFREHTVTTADAAASFARIRSDLETVASVTNDAAVASSATIAARSAGRLRVAVLGESSGIDADFDLFVDNVRVVVDRCHHHHDDG
ncbi:MAG: hypothetical protein QOE45_2000 [Frankiaceae bacterium]|jgi:hypothetical protein|nr:hypothetical protein [Frankiaceae bacterium]